MITLFIQEILRGGGKRDCYRLRMCVKLHIEQAQRSKTFRFQSEISERVTGTDGKGQKFLHQAEDRRIWEQDVKDCRVNFDILPCVVITSL